MLRNFKTFSGEAEVAGQTRQVSWDGEILAVHGVNSFPEAAEVLQALATGVATGWTGDALKQMHAGQGATVSAQVTGTITSEDPDRVVARVPDPGPPKQPDASPAAKPVPRTPPKLSKGGEPSVLPPVEEAPKPSTETAAPPDSPVADDNDTTIFTRLSTLREIVEECQRRGKADTFEQLKDYCLDLKDSLACPALERIEQAEGGVDGLIDRLSTMAFNKKIPGAAG